MANIKQGDNGLTLGLTIKENGTPVDIRDASVSVAFKTEGRRFSVPATITDGSTGKCEVELSAEDLAEAGFYTFEGAVTFANGKQFTSDSIRILVKAKL